MSSQALVARRLIGSIYKSSSLQAITFEAVLQDQLRRLRDKTGKQYRIVTPGSALGIGDVRYVCSVPEILPDQATLTPQVQRYASHIVVELAYNTPTDMRSMFNHAGKHLLQITREAQDLVVWNGTTVRDALNAEGLLEVTTIDLTVQEDRQCSYTFDEDGGIWYQDYRSYDSGFESYMDALGPTARFTLAVRLWLRVSKLNAHDIVSMISSLLVGTERMSLNYTDFSLHDGSVIEVFLPAHDGDIYIFTDSEDNSQVSVDSLAKTLARVYPEEALVPCAVAAGMSQKEATTFVRKLRRPHRRKRARVDD